MDQKRLGKFYYVNATIDCMHLPTNIVFIELISSSKHMSTIALVIPQLPPHAKS